jgi:Membrane-associated phospholipid phosphatase
MARREWYEKWFADEGLLGLHLTVGFIIALIAGVFFKLIADEVFEAPGIRTADAWAQAAANDIASPGLTRFMEVVTYVGNPVTLTILSLAIALLLYKEGSRRRLYTFSSIMGGGFLLNVLLKDAFHRTRPDLVQLIEAHGFSFPSGHSMGSMLFFGGLAYVLFFTAERHSIWRVIGVVVCFLASLLIGLSRVYLHVHFLSDVIAGFLAGLGWIGICVFGTESWIRIRDRRRKRKATQA